MQDYTVTVPRKAVKNVEKIVYEDQPAKRIETYMINVPQIRTRTKTRRVAKQVPETHQVQFTVLEPQERTHTVFKSMFKQVPVENTYSYTISVPQPRTRTVYRLQAYNVPETHTEQYCVTVPFQITVKRPYRVCKMIPRKIVVPVSCPVCPDVAALEGKAAEPGLQASLSQYADRVRRGWNWLASINQSSRSPVKK